MVKCWLSLMWDYVRAPRQSIFLSLQFSFVIHDHVIKIGKKLHPTSLSSTQDSSISEICQVLNTILDGREYLLGDGINTQKNLHWPRDPYCESHHCFSQIQIFTNGKWLNVIAHCCVIDYESTRRLVVKHFMTHKAQVQ